MVITIKMTAVL